MHLVQLIWGVNDQITPCVLIWTCNEALNTFILILKLCIQAEQKKKQCLSFQRVQDGAVNTKELHAWSYH